MNSVFGTVLLATAAVFVSIQGVSAAPSSKQVCEKMIANGRNGNASFQDCVCMYRVADAVFDDDIKTLVFDAWYTGKDNMTAVAKLPGRARVEKQMRTMKSSIDHNCK